MLCEIRAKLGLNIGKWRDLSVSVKEGSKLQKYKSRSRKNN